MKQASSVSKVNDELNKHKKLDSGRANTIQQRDNFKAINRLKSNNEGQQNQQLKQKTLFKPRSSMGRRPASSQKPVQSVTVKSIPTTSSAKSEQEVKEIINTIFGHSKKLHDFLNDKNLDQGQAYDVLINNELFTLSLISVISNKNPEEVSKCVQRCCIHKLDRIIAMEKQKKICDQLENKIGDLIDKRIKALSTFS